jgi:hypothetical protein
VVQNVLGVVGGLRYMITWDKIKYWLVVGVAASLILSYVAEKWNAPRVHVGDECGPGHHWVLVTSPQGDADLSCEADPAPPPKASEMSSWDMLFGVLIVVAWFAIAIWGATYLFHKAKQNNDWEKVWIAALSGSTVAGPLLFLMPNHIFFGINTIGLGAVLAIISAIAILWLTTPWSRLD